MVTTLSCGAQGNLVWAGALTPPATRTLGEVRNMKAWRQRPDMPEIQAYAVFLHIPRTGGTTMRHVMEANLPLEQIVGIYGPDIEVPEQVIQRLHQPTRDALKIVRGHIPYGIHKHLSWAQCFYFSLVRNPIERVWSLWHYTHRHKNHHLYDELQKLETIQAALEAQVSAEFNDGMCRQLSGIDGTFAQEPYVYGVYPYGETETVYETAMGHIDARRISVGATEHFGAFLSMFCDFMDFPNRKFKKSNAGPAFDPSKLSAGDRQAIEYYNRNDLKLWRAVKAVCE